MGKASWTEPHPKSKFSCYCNLPVIFSKNFTLPRLNCTVGETV